MSAVHSNGLDWFGLVPYLLAAMVVLGAAWQILRSVQLLARLTFRLPRPTGRRFLHTSVDQVRIYPLLGEETLWQKLTRREKDVAQLVARGLSNKEVANQLNIKVRTVDAHIQEIYRKLKVHSRAQLGHRYRNFVD